MSKFANVRYCEQAIIRLYCHDGEMGFQILEDSEHEDLRVEVATLKQELADKQSSYEAWKLQVAQMGVELADRNALLERKNKLIEDLQNGAKRREASMNQLSRDIVNLQRKNKELEQFKVKYDQLLEKLRTADTWTEVTA